MLKCFGKDKKWREAKKEALRFRRIPDRFQTIEQVTRALRQAGLESCHLMVGIDFTKSNVWSGEKSFSGRSLHSVDGPPNPYLQTLSMIARTLEDFDEDHQIPCYGFGDASTQAHSVFSLFPGNRPADGLQELLQRYRQIAPLVMLRGPTSFAPLIWQAMRHVYYSGMQFHLLLIVADGQISSTCLNDTVDAITTAAKFPLAIVMIGVGDGPWDTMQHFDDRLPQRSWDNFQFVEFDKIMNNPALDGDKRREACFAVNALMEVPDQYLSGQHLIGGSVQAEVRHIVAGIPPWILIEPPAHFDPVFSPVEATAPPAPFLSQ